MPPPASAMPLPNTLAIGVDVTWWGGGRTRASQSETIIAAHLDAPHALEITTVDLASHPNPARADLAEPNFDRDGEALTTAILDTIDRHPKVETVLIALDAPLECAPRADQPPRRRCVARGEPAGCRRGAEIALGKYQSELADPRARSWNADLRIQPGSPIPIRIARIVERFAAAGYPPHRASATAPPRGVIEVFPSEAIWALGTLGAHDTLDSTDVRAYKAKKPRHLSIADALDIARRPLAGFVPILGAAGVAPSIVTAWIDTITRAAVERATSRAGHVRKHKAFDDPIDSGIGFLTAVACAVGAWHQWGDGTDGTIVGPGRLPL